MRGLCLAAVAAALLIGRPALAAAPQCLSAVDGMIVEYDLPATLGEPGALPGSLSPPPSERPHARQKSAAGRQRPASAPHGTVSALPPRHALSEAQRKRLQDALQRARLAEARGNEEQCMELLRQAEAIVKPGG